MAPLLSLEIGHLVGSQEGLLSAAQAAPGPAELAAFGRFHEALRDGRLPISGPLYDDAGFAPTRGLARRLAGRYDTLLLLGIGGSTLGFRAVLNFIHGPFHNAFPGSRPKVFVVDNVDPAITGRLLSELDFARTLLVYVSKSGSTPEPAANFLVFLERLRAAGGRPADVVLICDPADNGINRIGRELGCHVLPIPKSLPGRYSVLSNVGVFPCEVAGIDTAELLRGARVAHEGVLAAAPEDNPCFLLGSLLHRYYKAQQRNIHFLFGYSNLLSELNLWFIQLWSESLGKLENRAGQEVRTGPTPVTAVGATDQHSILQLLKEGPRDKVIGFLKIGDFGDGVAIPRAFPDLEEYAYFGGHTLAEQLGIEQTSTEISLFRAGNPCYSITLDRPHPAALGCLFYFWELLVIYFADLEEIDPFDQPGVEEGKRMTYALMGRRDHARDRDRHARDIESYARAGRVLTLGD